MATRAQGVIEELGNVRAERSMLNQLFEEIAEVLAPERVGFTAPVVNRRPTKVFDTSPITSKRGLVNSIGAMLRPKSSAPGKWFDIVPENEELLDQREVKDWLDFAEDRLWRALYNPDAYFIQATGEIDDDLITFGTGVGFVGLRPDRTGLLFRSFHLKNVFIIVDHTNRPNGVLIAESLTPQQAAAKWGRENLGKKTLERLTSTDERERKEKSEFIWKVAPRFDIDPRVKNNINMPIMSLVVDVDSEHEVVEEGFEEFPFPIPRWDTRSGEVYGRGPGILALPDVLTLNQMGKTILRGLHRAVAPPWLLPSDSMVNAPQLKPDGVSYYDARAIRNLGITQPFQQMESRANIPWGLDAQAATREQIMAVFFKNILNLPIDAPQMTATEVIQRREEFVREIGSVFGRLESDYTNPIVERSFNLMMREGEFGAPEQIPEALQGGAVEFRFASPVEKAKRQIEEGTVTQAMDKVLAVGQIKPEIMDRFDWDEYGKFIAESNDFPSSLILDDAAVEAIKEANQEAAAQEQQMQTAERGASIAGALPPEMVEQVAGSG